MARTLITVPATAKRGEVIEIKTLIQHPMETGYRRSSEGAMMPRNLIRQFECRFERAGLSTGELVFSATLHAAIAANPYLSFYAVANHSGVFVFDWRGDNGFAHTERVAITVS